MNVLPRSVARLIIGIVSVCLLANCGDVSKIDESDQEMSTAVVATKAAEDRATSDELNHGAKSDDHVAEHHEKHEIRQAGTHLHGEANLAIAVDGNSLVVQFESPVYNLTGFEHAPKTQEDRDLVENVETLLTDPARLFVVNNEAGCKALPLLQTVSLGLEHTGDHASDDEHHSDHEDEHTSDHDSDGHHDDHESDHPSEGHDDDRANSHHEPEDHDNEAGHSQTHNDVLIDYRFRCASPEAINAVEVQLFEVFPRFEELEVVYLDQTRQRSLSLNRDNARLELDQ